MSRIRILLVGPKYPRNVGMVSRIMCNFGVRQLILIAPQCTINHEARQGAAQGQSPLDTIKIYSDWSSYYGQESDSLRIGFSRRHGKKRHSEPFKELLKSPILDNHKPLDLIFGAEDSGLSTEDLDMAHRLTHFDLPGPLKSMNLSHAVLYSLQQFYNSEVGFDSPTPRAPEAIKDPEPFLRLWLETLNFELDSQSRWNALTMLKRLIMRSAPSAEELHKLEMIVQQTVRKIRSPKNKNL